MSEIGIRARAIAVALIGVVPLSLFIQWSDLEIGGTIVAGPFPPIAASLFWAALAGLNLLWAGLQRSTGFLRRSELLLVLAVWFIANMVAGRGLLHPLLASIVGPAYYARTPTIENAVASHVPSWLGVTDKNAAQNFYEGHSAAVPWRLWWPPLLTWTLFFVPFLVANLCLTALFERVWVRYERLSFPVVALPIEVMNFGPGRTIPSEKGTSPIARTPFLLGLAAPVVLHSFGVVGAYVPGVPYFPVHNEVSDYFSNFPWSVVRPVYLDLYPTLIGLTYLAPSDVTLGVWLFLLVNKAEMLLTAINGWNDGAITYSTKSAPPFVEEQSAGAYLALGGMLIWNARQHLRRIGAALWAEKCSDAEHAEYAEYVPLAWGFVLGLVGMLAWCVIAGFPLWFSALYFGFYFMVALVLSRLMAEGGISWILAPILPDKLILSLFGSGAVSVTVLTRLAFLMQHLRDTRQMLLPALFEAGKMRDVIGFPLRRFYLILLAAMGIALVVGGARALPLFYQHGAVSLITNNDGLAMSARVIPLTGIGQAADRLQSPVGISSGGGIAVVIGAGIAYAFSILRLRYAWWPIHPLGYALTGTLQSGYASKMVLSIFLGWGLKALTLRFGGMGGFRWMRCAAFGLIVGDLLMSGIIKLLDALLGPSGYALN
ncbi:MAG: DUF6785 family protein [Armatimonadota bacterium]